ncbi:hypothetical protein DFJ58DRAFT_864143 [Suillus subalutaceus]|uniref:uncharacterized protein n=1 Tax=Suillus subalutaceus TaxID=48586 RepID=UPI001B87CFD2|nr:uncharacterized protein DFJ58DRAFT_864143 [Suillus subalutaceus]KAG1836893.1 hypothetical protein DFJ58DRAFT_864143 [Suillus subalutaceus]
MASTGMPVDAAVVTSLTLEGILYGFSIFMFLGTIYALTYNRRSDRPSLVVAVLLLILSTAHIVVNIIRAEDGLVKYRDTFLGGPVAFFEDVSQITYLIKNALYVMQTLVADGVVIYRCYIVWQSTRVIILPCMLWCGVAATGFHAIYSCSQASGSIYVPELAQWVMAFLVLTIATNLLSSGLLAYRIWMIERSVFIVRTTKSTLMPILRVLVDSAVLYSAVLFPALICFMLSNTGEVVVLNMAMPIMSIAFYMVLIRIAINRNRRFSTPRTASEIEQGNSRQYHMSPLQFHVSQFTNSDRTSVYETGTKDRPSIRTADSE